MNRLREGTEPDEIKPDAGDYFIVNAQCDNWYVSTEMAGFIESMLDREVRPLWLSFVDLWGARIRVRTALISAVCQRTAEQRASERGFDRALNRERKADRDWSEDE